VTILQRFVNKLSSNVQQKRRRANLLALRHQTLP
jgi:hypothetical protein